LALGGASKAKGMQLGAHKAPASASVAVFPTELEEEMSAAASIEASNPWGNDDLMDVNADVDDWSAFETAPVQIAVPKPVSAVATQSLRNGMASAHNQDSSWDDFGSASQTVSGSWTSVAPVQTSPASQTRKGPTPSRMKSPARATPSPLSSRVSSPAPAEKRVLSPVPVSTTPSTVGMSKEEKAAEMARRKEERKQRIAQLKEQKRNAGAK